jgi:hypothetical protein
MNAPSVARRAIAIVVGCALAAPAVWWLITDRCLDLGGRVTALSCEFAVGDPLPLFAAAPPFLTVIVVGLCGVLPYLVVLLWPFKRRTA